MSHQLIVAIGRESGSGGLDIAHALAERLQLPLFDKSILQKALTKDAPAVIINAWNEWTEGMALLPDEHYQSGFLDAIKETVQS